MDDVNPPAQPASERDDTEHLLGFVASRDVPCPACGYNLRMLSKPICPECGLALKLTVGSDEPFRRAWALALGVNAMIAGIGLFFLLISAATGDVPMYERNAWLWFGGPILWIPLPFVIYFLRRRFCRLASALQYSVIFVALFAMVIFAIALVADFN